MMAQVRIICEWCGESAIRSRRPSAPEPRFCDRVCFGQSRAKWASDLDRAEIKNLVSSLYPKEAI